jgi:uncharacterized protein (UPF0333 family)
LEEKAQVNLEYLLIIIAVIVIATAVALYIKTTANSASEAVIDKASSNS